MTGRLRQLGLIFAGLCAALLSVAAPAMAATASGPALQTHGGGPGSNGWHRAVAAASSGGMPGWEIALIALAAALVIWAGDRALTRARAARRPIPGTG